MAGSAYGKSLIYQFPPIFLKKIIIVLSPLVCIMETQCWDLNEKGINAVFFNSSSKRLNNIKIDSSVQVIYTTPETFSEVHSKLVEVNLKSKVCMIAIDECHAISRKSSDHRLQYANLKFTRDYFPTTPLVCLTSTASTALCEEIAIDLKLVNPLMLSTELNRPNITYIAREKSVLEANFLDHAKSDILEVHNSDGNKMISNNHLLIIL